MRRWMKQIMVWLVAAACGFAAALVICRWNGTALRSFHVAGHCRGRQGSWWPAWDFFQQKERVRFSTGICAAACLFCMIVQTAMAV